MTFEYSYKEQEGKNVVHGDIIWNVKKKQLCVNQLAIPEQWNSSSLQKHDLNEKKPKRKENCKTIIYCL